MAVINQLPQPAGGGSPTVTTLWTNANPSSNFSGQTVTLSQAMTNFTLIKIAYKYTTTADVYNVYFDTTNYTYTGAYADEFSLISRPGTAGYVRRLTMASTTTISISTSYRLNASGDSTAYCIPVGIYGVN